MKKIHLFTGLLLAGIWLACTDSANPTAAFAACSTDCTAAALQLRDQFLDDPKAVLKGFRKDTALLRRWVETLRDAYFFNDSLGAAADREDLKQQMITAAERYKDDPRLGAPATTLADELGFLAIMAEEEDGEPLPELPFTGTYGYQKPGDAGNGQLQVSRLDLETIRFSLLVAGGPPAHNQGMLEGTATLQPGNIARYKTAEFGGVCQLQFTFSGTAVEIKTLEGDAAACGFGNNISADGVYAHSSADDPFLSGADAQTAKNLQGRWQSLEDAKAEVRFENGWYIDLYGGEELTALPYQFFPKCPGFCDPVAPMPCVSVIGQDALCYAVVKADGKALELSMIGGRGNTLRFRRR